MNFKPIAIVSLSVLVLLLLSGFKGNPSRYQAVTGDKGQQVFVLDTLTGQVKLVHHELQAGKTQLGKSFSDMSAVPKDLENKLKYHFKIKR